MFCRKKAVKSSVNIASYKGQFKGIISTSFFLGKSYIYGTIETIRDIPR